MHGRSCPGILYPQSFSDALRLAAQAQHPFTSKHDVWYRDLTENSNSEARLPGVTAFVSASSWNGAVARDNSRTKDVGKFGRQAMEAISLPTVQKTCRDEQTTAMMSTQYEAHQRDQGQLFGNRTDGLRIPTTMSVWNASVDPSEHCRFGALRKIRLGCG